MLKRCIGIDVGSSHVRAVQVARAGQRFRVEKVFCTPTRRSPDSPSDILKSLTTEYGFDRRADVAVSMPRNTVFFRRLETDLSGPQQIHEHPSSVSEHNFPIQTDDVITQTYGPCELPDQQSSALIAATDRKSLKATLGVLAGATLHPKIVEPAIFAIHSTIVLNYPKTVTQTAMISYIDDSCVTLALVENGGILSVRNIPLVPLPDDPDLAGQRIADVVSREARITWRKVHGTGTKPESTIYLVGPTDIADGLRTLLEADLHCETVIVDPCAQVQRCPDCQADWQICVAEGLALRALAPGQTTGVNFLDAPKFDEATPFSLKKELVICTTLAAAIAVVWLAGLFTRLSYLETHYANIKGHIAELFHRTLPQEQNMVSPLAQLQQKLDSLRDDRQLLASFDPMSLTPLQVLHAISTKAPPQADIQIQDLLIAADSVRLTGTCDSFASLSKWRRLLQDAALFTAVDAQDIHKEPKTGTVRFTILLFSRSIGHK